ncbi:MAG: hypothetical protein KBC48_01965 [Candidatus Pacebacteria bacterium]|nr:hypothetical protein [Candidatus Paceibacterota bacterium]
MYKVILFYKFINLRSPNKVMAEQKALASACNLKGRMLIAEEGINATFEGLAKDIAKYKRELKKDKRFSDMVFKESVGDGTGFTKLKIKVRPEVVTLGVGKLNIKKDTAKEVTAAELEKMYKKDEDFVVLDLRNDFEVKAGYFDKTINPELANFRDLPAKLKELKKSPVLKDKKVVTVCTGGIRCEKATALMKQEGFKNLYQLKDGIHTYMAKYPASHFKGSLFVFDNRLITPVVETKKLEVVGECVYCGATSEDFYNDDSYRPSRKVIVCDNCIPKYSTKLRQCI